MTPRERQGHGAAVAYGGSCQPRHTDKARIKHPKSVQILFKNQGLLGGNVCLQNNPEEAEGVWRRTGTLIVF